MADNIVLEEIRSQISSGLIQGAAVRTNLSEETIAAGIQAGDIPMSPESRFDIASTGKVFTAGCTALLALEGKIDLDAPFTEYFPEHELGKKCDITIRDLASHASGFDNSKPYAADSPGENIQRLALWMPVNPRRSTFCYSCGNYILLGKIIERISGMDLDALSRRLLWDPLKMHSTTWNAPGPGPLEVQHHFPTRAPGEHNDDVCFRVGVPMGSGSAFSTAGDMFLFVNDIVERKTFPQAYYDLICAPEFFQEGKPCRSFGWDMRTDALPAGLSPRTIHHTGFTGQSIFADPETGICGAVLTSRTGNWALAKTARSRIMELIIQTAREKR